MNWGMTVIVILIIGGLMLYKFLSSRHIDVQLIKNKKQLNDWENKRKEIDNQIQDIESELERIKDDHEEPENNNPDNVVSFWNADNPKK